MRYIFYALLCIGVALANFFLITTIVDCVLMGKLHFHFATKCRKKQFVISGANRIDIQDGYKCSAFSSAYLLRHWGVEAGGNELYGLMPNKMKDGYVYPKGIQKLLPQYGFRVKYCAGNIAALKNAVSIGSPVIVMIRIRPDKNWLHYVPVVGYDEENIFVAESLAELANCDGQSYNRKIPIGEFKKLWNTAMLKLPLYRNTYMTATLVDADEVRKH